MTCGTPADRMLSSELSSWRPPHTVVKEHRKNERDAAIENYSSSDYIVNSKEEAAQFAIKAGRLAAFSLIFGAGDRHVENLIVSAHNPYLIDLENSLLPEIFLKNLGFTSKGHGSLIGTSGADITHYYFDQNKGVSAIGFRAEQKNRLYYLHDHRLMVFDVRDFNPEFMKGFKEIMNILNEKTFAAWFENPLTSKMTLRVLPFATSHFRNNLRTLIQQNFSQESLEQGVIGEALSLTELQTHQDYREYSPVIYFDPTTLDELLAYNIPVFYMKADEKMLLNSKGEPLEINDSKALKALSTIQEDSDSQTRTPTTQEELREFANQYYIISPLENLHLHMAKMIAEPTQYIDHMASEIEHDRSSEEFHMKH